MDERGIFARVMAEAGRLGLAWWERVALILAAALVIVMGQEARRVLREIPITPQPLDPERDPSLPDAQSNLTTDPDNPGGGSGGG